MSDPDGDDLDGYGSESGPFCVHWGDPDSCHEPCERCGHECCEHDMYGDTACLACCDCRAFEDETTRERRYGEA